MFISFILFIKGLITYFNFIKIIYQSLLIESEIGSFIVFLFISLRAFLYCSELLIDFIFKFSFS